MPQAAKTAITINCFFMVFPLTAKLFASQPLDAHAPCWFLRFVKLASASCTHLRRLCGTSNIHQCRDGVCSASLKYSATRARPARRMPNRSAAASLTSMMYGPALGPRSLMRTQTSRPLPTLTTRSRVPSGKVRCAAVRACRSNRSPLAVRRPCQRLPPYHVAHPLSTGSAVVMACWSTSGDCNTACRSLACAW